MTATKMILFSSVLATCASARRSRITADLIPESDSTLVFPNDAYLHVGAPFEWYYHVGKLETEDGRRFGFSAINNASPAIGFGAASMSIADVDAENPRYYERTTVFAPPEQWDPLSWAETNPTQPFRAELGVPERAFDSIGITNRGGGYAFPPLVQVLPCPGQKGEGATAVAFLNTGNDGEDGEPGQLREIVLIDAGSGYDCVPEVVLVEYPGAPPPLVSGSAEAIKSFISMRAVEGSHPFKGMTLDAVSTDYSTGMKMELHLDAKQARKRDPILMFGDGEVPVENPQSNDPNNPLIANNYYYALTDLKTTGALTIGDETFDVSGRTWRDHQYGGFPLGTKWVLQHITLSGGVRLSAVRIIEDDTLPDADTPLDCIVSVQVPRSVCKRHAKSKKIKRSCENYSTYFVNGTFVLDGDTLFESERTGSQFYTKIDLEIPDFDANLSINTLLADQEQASNFIYEGLADVNGIFLGKCANGDAWVEQSAFGTDFVSE